MTTRDDTSSPTFVVICQRLHAAQLSARTPAQREAADADLGHLLRMSAAGRFQEWVDSHPEQASEHEDRDLSRDKARMALDFVMSKLKGGA